MVDLVKLKQAFFCMRFFSSRGTRFAKPASLFERADGLQTLEFRLVSEDMETLFLRLQNLLERGKDAGKVHGRLRGSRLLWRRSWLFLGRENHPGMTLRPAQV